MRSYQVRAIVVDASLTSVTWATFLTIRSEIDPQFQPEGFQKPVIFFTLVAIWLLGLALNGCYDTRYLGTGVEEFRRVVRGSIQAFLFCCFLALVFKLTPSRLNLFVGLFVGIIVIATGRKILQNRLRSERLRGESARCGLVIGSSEYASMITAQVNKQPELGMKIVGRIPVHQATSLHNQDTWLRTVSQAVEESDIKYLIIEDSPEADADMLSKLSWHFNKDEVEIMITPTFLKNFGPRLEFENHQSLPLIYLDEPTLSLGERLEKRILDFFISIIGITVLLPFMILIGIGVFVSSPGPIFFTQDRIGLEGQRFRFTKFRSMVVGADKMRQDILGTPDEEMTERYKADPRIFAFGRFIRRFSLDETPQLFTVLLGKMSIVGPRPLLIEELELLGDEDHRRHLTKPGLTGLWQINGRKETTWDQRIQLDLQYVHRWSIGLDIGIVLKTVKVVLTGHGSY